MNSILSVLDLEKKEIEDLIELASAIKKTPDKYKGSLSGKLLLMIFEKPSLRTKVSFQAAMKSMGGDAIVLEKQTLPLISKESIEDTARVSSRYVHGIMARLFSHDELVKLKENSTVPVINGLTDEFHPVQIICDLLTIKEKKGSFDNLKVAYFGDGLNNVTHSLILGCALLGIDLFVSCPGELMPKKEIIEKAKEISTGKVIITEDTVAAAENADVIYTDTWMSYHISPKEKEHRIKLLSPYQVNPGLVKHAKKDYIFMNCLPAMRGYEQTDEIIDSVNSVVFDQAENRLHMQKAILMKLMGNNNGKAMA